MKLQSKHIALLLSLTLHFCSVSGLFCQNGNPTSLLTKQEVYTAGERIILKFKTSSKSHLYCHSSYGSVIVFPDKTFGKGAFLLPDFLSKKKGIVDYNLVVDNKIVHTGSITIVSSPKETLLESYIGPPSISAGGHDFTMMVVIPTDSYDNPLEDGIKANIKHQFSETIQEEPVLTKDFIFWKNIFSQESSGRLLMSSSINDVTSKEFSVEVFPAQPTNFTIDYTRKHGYADGNQITRFSTTVIKDAYGNVVSDGTLVDLIIKNEKGSILKAQGSTIKGVATIDVLHPDHKSVWKISAYVSGMATSNTITLTYDAITNQLPVVLSSLNRKITIGPLKSFMDQILPDGGVVKLHISQQGNTLETKIKTTREGMVEFILPEDFYESGTYSFTIEALGITKTYLNVAL